MFGAVVGDIVGSVYEWNNHKSKDFVLFRGDCTFTDDTVMTMAIAKAVIESGGDKTKLGILAVKYMQDFGIRYSGRGYGGNFALWIKSSNPQPYNSFGNGSAMRVYACGLAAKSIEDTKSLSCIVTEVTHNHPEGIKGAECVAVCIYLAKTKNTLSQIKEYVQNNYYKINFTLDEIRDTYEFNESCQGSVPQALAAFFESTSFEDALRNAISIGGDSDTIAAITCSIAAVYYSIPQSITCKALSYITAEFIDIMNEFEQKFDCRF